MLLRRIRRFATNPPLGVDIVFGALGGLAFLQGEYVVGGVLVGGVILSLMWRRYERS